MAIIWHRTFNLEWFWLSFNYVENGYIDSIGLLGFMADIEDQFGITFSDEELNSKEFQVIGSLVEMIYEKINN